jgi:ATP-dependent RNA helicase DDX51/DBP6
MPPAVEEDDEDPLPFVDVPDDLAAPVDDVDLHPHLRAVLKAMGIRTLFPVQAATIPWLLRAEDAGVSSDLAVCAPTGSGKTLAYALPIVHCLLPRVVRRLRAVVVLPTRSLALQVCAVFESLTAGSDLVVGTALGDVPFAQERAALVGRGDAQAPGASGCATHPDGGASLVDILIATPGRLVDQLRADGGRGLTLQHARWLVIDEADRLMAQVYDQWLPALFDSAHPPLGPPPRPAAPPLSCRPAQPLLADRSRGVALFAPPLRKLLFSATLSNDPQGLAALQLLSPVYLRVGLGRFAMPQGLHEEYAVCARALKPLHLVGALERLGLLSAAERVLCFTASVEGAPRLARVLQLLGRRALEFSSNLDHATRADVLARFADGRCQLLVASDAMARGLDIEHVRHVINYDAPTRIRTYMHRAGRTARAGREGTCTTLLTRDQTAHFKAMLAQAGRTPTLVHIDVEPPGAAHAGLGGGAAARARAPADGDAAAGAVAPPSAPTLDDGDAMAAAAVVDEAAGARARWIQRYESTLGAVKRVVELERRGLLALHAPVPDSLLLLRADDDDDADARAPLETDVGGGANGGAEAGWDAKELRRDRVSYLAKVVREQLVERARSARDARKGAKRARRLPVGGD